MKPDAEIAAALDQAAALALAQGAPIVAAELGEHALRLTPSSPPEDVTAGRSPPLARTWRLGSTLTRGSASRAISSPGRRLAGRRAEALVLLSRLSGARRASSYVARRFTRRLRILHLQARIHQRLQLGVVLHRGPQVVRAACASPRSS